MARHNQRRSSPEPGGPGNTRYMVLTGHERQIERVVVTRKERASLPKDGFDFYYDRASGEMFIALYNGKVEHFDGRCPLGPETYGLLWKILMAASDFVPLDSEDWQYAQVSRMRAVFEDPPGEDHFFKVLKNPEYCIRVQPHIRWRIITVTKDDNSRKSV